MIDPAERWYAVQALSKRATFGPIVVRSVRSESIASFTSRAPKPFAVSGSASGRGLGRAARRCSSTSLWIVRMRVGTFIEEV